MDGKHYTMDKYEIDVMNMLGIKPSIASELLKDMVEHGIIEQRIGHGKGKSKYVFHSRIN